MTETDGVNGGCLAVEGFYRFYGLDVERAACMRENGGAGIAICLAGHRGRRSLPTFLKQHRNMYCGIGRFVKS
jgi:hypothetical protein